MNLLTFTLVVAMRHLGTRNNVLVMHVLAQFSLIQIARESTPNTWKSRSLSH